MRNSFLVNNLNLKLLIISVLTVCWNGNATGQQTDPASGNLWSVETVLGESHQSPRLGIDEGLVKLSGETGRIFPLGEIVSIESGQAIESTPSLAGPSILFTTGGELRCTVKSISAENVQATFQGSQISVALEGVAAIVWKDSARLQQILKNPSDATDQVIVSGQDELIVVEGIFEKLDAGKLSIQYQGESRTMDSDRIEAIVPARIGTVAAADRAATLTLVEGSLIGGRVVKLNDDTIEMQVPGSSLVLPTSSVASIRFVSDRVQRLSDLDPVDSASSVMFAPDRGWRRNLSVEGNPITLRIGDGDTTRKFRNGIGMQSTSRLGFSNENGFDRLRGLVGIDIETEGRGDCVVVVRGDGIRLWESRLQANQAAVDVDVDVTGMKTVELVVEPGAQFDLADHVGWAEIRLIRTR